MRMMVMKRLGFDGKKMKEKKKKERIGWFWSGFLQKKRKEKKEKKLRIKIRNGGIIILGCTEKERENGNQIMNR
jgi:hypothetical protein